VNDNIGYGIGVGRQGVHDVADKLGLDVSPVDRVHSDELMARYRGLLGGMLNEKTYAGLRAWNTAAKTFMAPAGTTYVGNPLAHQAIDNVPMSIALEYGTRGLQTTDAFFRTILEHSAMQAMATREARNLNNGNHPTTEQIADVMASPSREMLGKVRAEADRMLFLEQPIEQARALTRFVRGLPLGFMISPIIRTPANIGRAAVETFDPFGVSTRRSRETLAAGGGDADKVRAQQLVAGALWLGAAALIANGTITGGGPEDPQARAEWLMGNIPYSIAGKYPLKDIAPVGTGLATIADLYEAYQNGIRKPNQTAMETTMQIAGGLAQGVMQNSYLSSTSDFFKDGPTAGLKNLLGSAVQASANVPLYSQIQKERDPLKRDLSMGEGLDASLKDKAAAMDNPMISHYFPGVGSRNELPASRNEFGELIHTDNPISSDPVAKEVARLAGSTGKPVVPAFSRTVKGAHVPNDIYDNFLAFAGPIMRTAVSQIMENPTYQKALTDEQRATLISSNKSLKGLHTRLDKQLEMMVMNRDPKFMNNFISPTKQILSTIPGE
jgi:hypothetical protein